MCGYQPKFPVTPCQFPVNNVATLTGIVTACTTICATTISAAVQHEITPPAAIVQLASQLTPSRSISIN